MKLKVIGFGKHSFFIIMASLSERLNPRPRFFPGIGNFHLDTCFVLGYGTTGNRDFYELTFTVPSDLQVSMTVHAQALIRDSSHRQVTITDVHTIVIGRSM